MGTCPFVEYVDMVSENPSRILEDLSQGGLLLFKKNQPQLTGPDYLSAVAEEAKERGQPWAEEFGAMLWNAFDTREPVLLIHAQATRPLKEFEASPVSIILGAYQMAMTNKDLESANEVLRVGLALLAKWPDWLCSTADGHPELMWKPESDKE